MPREPRRRGAIPRRSWAAAVAVAAALAAAVAPAGAQPPKDPPPPAQCVPGSGLDPAAGATVTEIFSRARSGVTVEPGGIDPPALTVGRPARLLVRMGPDPLGIAALLGVEPAAFWGAAGARVSAWGPGFYERGPVEADGSARVSFTPPRPGAVRVRVYVPGKAILDALGACSSTPFGVGSPLVRPGEEPGAPLLQVEDLPEPPPDPGGETSP